MSHRHHLIGLIAAALLLGAGASAGLAGVDYFWDANWASPPNGFFDDEMSWNPEGVPGSNDRAVFDLPNTYTVMFTYTEYSYSFILSCLFGDVTLTSEGARREYRLGHGGGAMGRSSDHRQPDSLAILLFRRWLWVRWIHLLTTDSKRRDHGDQGQQP